MPESGTVGDEERVGPVWGGYGRNDVAVLDEAATCDQLRWKRTTVADYADHFREGVGTDEGVFADGRHEVEAHLKKAANRLVDIEEETDRRRMGSLVFG